MFSTITGDREQQRNVDNYNLIVLELKIEQQPF